MKGVRRGCVRLKDAVIGIDDQEDNTFTITVDHKTFHFQVSKNFVFDTKNVLKICLNFILISKFY